MIVSHNRPSMLLIVFALSASLFAGQKAYAESEQALDALRIATLARHGEFGQLRHALEENPAIQSPATEKLLQTLARYEHNQQKRLASRQEAYDRQVGRIEQYFEEDKLQEALVAAIEARNLSFDEEAFFEKPLLKQLAEQADAHAQEAYDQDNFIRALSYYRLLDLLYEDEGTYRDRSRGVLQRIRILQLYAPKYLKGLLDAERERRKEKDKDATSDQAPIDVEPDAWDIRLKGVELSMLQQGLWQAQRAHIDRPEYLKMLQGAINSFKFFLQTPALDESFPSLADESQKKRMMDFLTNLEHSLAEEDKQINAHVVLETIDRIANMNKLTLDLPEPVVVYELSQGFTDELDDFTAVVWPEDLERFSRSTQGRFYGVGIQISRRDGRLVVVTPLANTPAQRAGVRAGDIIASVDGRDTSAWSLDRAVREITGPEGEVVTLGIERRGQADLFEIPITRAAIEIESIRGWQHTPDGGWDYMLDADSGIGYVRLLQFIPQSADDLDKAIESLIATEAFQGLILDMRSNPGGLLSSAVEISDRFVEQGPIVSTVDGQGRQTNRHTARHQASYPDIPIVILINTTSASASEIVAGALQDYGRAWVVGERSFGKGSVQDLYPLARGRAFLKLTTQHYMLPLGRIIHRELDSEQWGIEPDLVVPMTNRELVRLLEYRSRMDVLDNGELETEALENLPEDVQEIAVKPDDADMDPDREAFEQLLETGTVIDILEAGLDPQLEAAVLIVQAEIAKSELMSKRELAKRDARNEPAKQ